MLNVSGAVTDEAGRPLADVNVALYRVHRGMPDEKIKVTRTDAGGKYQFSKLEPLVGAPSDYCPYYAVVATAKGRASRIEQIITPDAANVPAFRMLPAETLRGQVVDGEGKPVEGASVWAGDFWGRPLEGVMSAKTGPDGQFAITDLTTPGSQSVGNRSRDGSIWPTSSGYVTVRHPRLGQNRTFYRYVPSTRNIRLTEGGVLRGRVVDVVTGQPAAEVVVCIQAAKQSPNEGTDQGGAWHETRTDGDGNYHFVGLAPVTYNVWAGAANRVCAALNSVAVVARETCEAADLRLEEGSWLEGRVLTPYGEPVSREPKTGERLKIGLYGPARPRSGTVFESCLVEDDGRFRLRVAAGRNFPQILCPDVWQRTWRKDRFERGIDVVAGQPLAVNFRILDRQPRPPPPPRPARDSVKLPPPVPEERDAAETIRDLGGWYALDEDGHVVEINMVYHEPAGGGRLDNKYTESDEAMRIAPAFARLKRLFLHKGQATDESMECLADLTGLEMFFVWDATALTDLGVKHLAHLENLRNVHISNSAIGDAALEALAMLPKLTKMSMQQNAFTDAGLAHLAGMEQLRSLWIGMSKGKITDAGLTHLAGLKHLEELDLQRSQVTDAGLEHLKGLEHLRSLYLSGTPVTAKGKADLKEALPNLQAN
jgi:protocatechuate 3,4-dioxygenase beta subunit